MKMTIKAVIDRLNRQARQKAIDDADEVEWQAVREGSAIVEYGIADEIISGELLDAAELIDDSELDVNVEAPSWMARAESEEKEASAVGEEIERRRLILQEGYPFNVGGHRLEYSPSEDGIYEFCLAVSVSRKLTQKPFNELPQAFEALSKEVLVGWMGPGAKGWQTGFPGRITAGLPSTLPELWRDIHEETGEWEWQLGKSIPEDAEDDQKDLGMDFLIWKSINDVRPHALFLAGQCACGRDALNGNGKSSDLKSSWLNEWFRVTSKVDFVPCLLLPRCLGASASEVRARSGTLFFDRLRLVSAARQLNPDTIGTADITRFARLTELVKNDIP